MITDINQMSYDEVRNVLILSKELLASLTHLAPDDFCFRSYSTAYIAVADAVKTLDRVQIISGDIADTEDT